MRRWRSYYFLMIPVIALIVFFQFPRLNESVHSIFSTLARPVFVLGSSLRDGLYALRYQSGNFLDAIGKQKEYLARIQELEGQLVHFREMDLENQRLKKLLNFSLPLAMRTIGVRIIGEDATPWKKIHNALKIGCGKHL